VLTVHSFGQGKAYYLASRAKEPFYGDFYARLIREAGVSPVMDTELPQGVTVQLRSDGSTDYVFVLNFTGEDKQVDLDEREYRDLLGGDPVAGSIKLEGYGARLLARSTI